MNQLLHAVRLRSAIHCRAQMTGGWGFRTDTRDHPRFHFITAGKCWISVGQGKECLELTAGDLVILTNGQAHSVRSHPDAPVEHLAEILVRLPLDVRRNFFWDNGDDCTTMLCGGLVLDERRVHPLLAALPPVIVVRGHTRLGATLRSAFRLIEEELMSGAPGSEAVISRLSDTMFLQAIRSILVTGLSGSQDFLRALSDPAIGKSVIALHLRLEQPWTVRTLALEAGMSRSSFSARFTQLVGMPPMSYLSRWRMARAALLLRTTEDKISYVAVRVGYESEGALSKAFKRCFGTSPGVYRRRSGSIDAPPPAFPAGSPLERRSGMARKSAVSTASD